MVLLVDDQAMIGEAVRRGLSNEENIDFHFCADPHQAIAHAVRIKPTVILQDLVMPGLDGLSLVREYRNHPATRDIPIIVLSTKEDPLIKSAAFAAGANDYLVKLPDIIVMALGMLLVIVAGHIDLSVGSVCGFIGAVAAVLMVNYNWHYVPATIVCLILGGVIGAAQGYWVAFYKIPSFIVTLAGMLVFKGLALAVLEGASVGPFPP
eukprot:gene3110-3666_t